MTPIASPTLVSRRFSIQLAPAATSFLFLLALGACKDKPTPQRPTPTVSVVTVAKAPLPYIVSANGQVEPNRTVAVQSLVSGQLTRVAISEGDEVREGQLLFQIDPRPFRAEVERAQATLARDEATLTRARSDSVRFASLAKDGYVTKQQLDQAFAEASALAATVSAGRATLQRARLDLENTTVKAPISGRTGQLLYKAGSLVRASADQLVTINEVRPVLVRFPVPERDFEEMRTRAGLDKALKVKVLPGPDTTKVITGVLTFVDNQVDRATGSVLLKARVANEDRLLWPGQFVSVALQLSVDEDAITIPSEAVVTSGTSSFVYTMEDGKAKRMAVKVGRPAGTRVKIDSGLVGGEQVITEGQARLRDGAKVQLRKPAGAQAGRGGKAGEGRGGQGGSNQ
ncbi:efflux RND transporter periplasmic adaptor subunit [Gemmatimonas sp.]|uniref:efflux RND transporter periplasmic adaptor subunit n=1 Tax=Gemmatimonas sp. TaxID=1962908 RepID=UPI0037BFCF53